LFQIELSDQQRDANLGSCVAQVTAGNQTGNALVAIVMQYLLQDQGKERLRAKGEPQNGS
jgi:hypothetical protein